MIEQDEAIEGSPSGEPRPRPRIATSDALFKGDRLDEHLDVIDALGALPCLGGEHC